jgi:hypothetical protein
MAGQQMVQHWFHHCLRATTKLPSLNGGENWQKYQINRLFYSSCGRVVLGRGSRPAGGDRRRTQAGFSSGCAAKAAKILVELGRLSRAEGMGSAVARLSLCERSPIDGRSEGSHQACSPGRLFEELDLRRRQPHLRNHAGSPRLQSSANASNDGAIGSQFD